MVNTETIQVIGVLNKLAALSAGGIRPFFTEATESNRELKLFFDETGKDKTGGFPVILESFVKDMGNGAWHREINRTYDNVWLDHVIIRAFPYPDNENRYYVSVTVEQHGTNPYAEFRVENGVWSPELLPF